jgi:prepilin-type N-terminal cleavage/methylation domain-containing protein
MRHTGFTLIELLVVVAIIAILTAIALPNFIEAQMRAKTARARSDMRTLVLALEAYLTDHNAYPPATGVGEYDARPDLAAPVHVRFVPLTTPTAYLSALPLDPFPPARSVADFDDVTLYTTYDYLDAPAATYSGSGATSGAAWRLLSAGPDRLMAWGGKTASDPLSWNDGGVDYDPTNGTRSAGDLVRVAGMTAPTGNGGSPDDLTNPMRPGILRVPSYREQYH